MPRTACPAFRKKRLPGVPPRQENTRALPHPPHYPATPAPCRHSTQKVFPCNARTWHKSTCIRKANSADGKQKRSSVRRSRREQRFVQKRPEFHTPPVQNRKTGRKKRGKSNGNHGKNSGKRGDLASVLFLSCGLFCFCVVFVPARSFFDSILPPAKKEEHRTSGALRKTDLWEKLRKPLP